MRPDVVGAVVTAAYRIFVWAAFLFAVSCLVGEAVYIVTSLS